MVRHNDESRPVLIREATESTPRVRALARADKFDRFVSILEAEYPFKFELSILKRISNFLNCE